MAIENVIEAYGNKLIGLGGGGSSTGGHTIENQTGTAMAQQPNMQFADSFVTNDSVGEATVVENVKEVAPADYASTTDEGIIVTDDGDDALIGAVSDDYVEVTADGVKTFAQVFADLRALADLDKMTLDATLVINGTDIYKVAYKTSNGYQFSRASSSSSGARVQYASLILNSEGFNISTGSTNNDASSSHPSDGMKFTLYYGNKKATVDLQTTANRCLMPDGTTTVADRLTWKYWGDVSGTFDLPTNYNELFIKCNIDGINVFSNIVVPKIALGSSEKTYGSGNYALSNVNYGFEVKISPTTIKTNWAYKNGTDVTSNSTVSVYYR